jgi:hypothetical protein
MKPLNLGLATILAASICFASCGDSDRRPAKTPSSAGQAGEPGQPGQPGRAGEGGSPDLPDSVPCGPASCRPVPLPDGDFLPTCCADPSQGICGAEAGALLPGMGCVPLTQPGETDPSCPWSPAGAAGLPLPPLPGCCNPTTQQCGYMISDFGGLLPIAPGCVDSTLLVPDETPRACGDDGGDGGRGPGGGTGGAGGLDIGSGGADAVTGGVSGADTSAAGAGGAG